jgi:hypothetical protein
VSWNAKTSTLRWSKSFLDIPSYRTSLLIELI